MPTTASYFYTLTYSGQGKYSIGLLPGSSGSGPFTITVEDTPRPADQGPDDAADDQAILGDVAQDIFITYGDMKAPGLLYAGTLVGDDSAIVSGGGGNYFVFSDVEYADGDRVIFKAVNVAAGTNQYDLANDRAINVTCFAEGTRILTARGEVAVERLSAGDRVVTFSGRGAALKPVRWIGRRAVDVAGHREPHRVRPVRIRAGALGEGVPHRDLVVSPEHALLLDGALVHAKTLVNGATVVQEDRAAVVYFHLDLGCHDVVLAEGAGAESYLNEDGRASFDNAASAGVVALRAGDAAAVPAYAPCAPFLREGPALLAILAGVMGRAEALGWVRSDEHGLHLRADGRVIRGEAPGGGVHRFVVPAGTGVLEVVSRAGRPLGTVPGRTDGRWLGVQLGGLGFEGPGREAVEVPLDHPGLGRGFSHLEIRGDVARRWTTGGADLSAALGEGLATGGVLTLLVTGTPGYWVRAPGAEGWGGLRSVAG